MDNKAKKEEKKEVVAFVPSVGKVLTEEEIIKLINFMSPFFIAWFTAHFTPLQFLIDKIYEY